MRFYDLNERAFAYHRHCLSTQGAIDPTFLKTLEFVADELFRVSVANNPTMKREYIKNQILERRYKIQYQLDNANINEGCNSAESFIAKQHYEQFSNFAISDIRKFIGAQTID